jgi:hypothetical protein
MGDSMNMSMSDEAVFELEEVLLAGLAFLLPLLVAALLF